MKKLLTIALIALMALGTEAVIAQGNSKGKAKGKPSFVDEKHRAHAEWKREKEYAKAQKKYNKKNDDRWDDDDDRWRKDDRRREDSRRVETRDREWEKVEERRREEERQDGDKTLRDIILGRYKSN